MAAFVAGAVLLSLLLVASPAAAFNRYTVGGSKGWNPGVNYSLWENKTHFYVEDWLVFLYQPGQADVLVVNETAYNQCLIDNPISNWSRGRSYAYRLNHTGDYYFICSRGYCYNGMKLHIKAEKVPPPSSPPSLANLNAAAASLRSRAARVAAFAGAVAAAVIRSI